MGAVSRDSEDGTSKKRWFGVQPRLSDYLSGDRSNARYGRKWPTKPDPPFLPGSILDSCLTWVPQAPCVLLSPPTKNRRLRRIFSGEHARPPACRARHPTLALVAKKPTMVDTSSIFARVSSGKDFATRPRGDRSPRPTCGKFSLG